MLTSLSKSEACYVAGLKPVVIDRAIDRGRLSQPFVIRRARLRELSPKGAFLIAADHLMARDVAAPARLKLRRRLAEELKMKPITAIGEVSAPGSILRLRIDLSGVAADVSTRLAQLEAALALIVEDDEVQAGAPTFRGTRVLVRPIAEALRHGADRAELKDDYRLNDLELDAALIFAEARPARGRPVVRKPA